MMERRKHTHTFHKFWERILPLRVELQTRKNILATHTTPRRIAKDGSRDGLQQHKKPSLMVRMMHDARHLSVRFPSSPAHDAFG